MATHLQLPIIEKTIHETIGLLGETRDWVAKNINSRNYSPTNERFDIVTHQCKVVVRLEWVMAWLMFRKAVATGEIDQSHALKEIPPLDVQDDYLAQHDPEINYLPKELETLLDLSHALYSRVARLDALVRDDISSDDEGANEIHLPN